MAWRLAQSLATLRTQINTAYPNRRKSSDGTIGDEDHASRSSDHNPWISDNGVGVVSAIDFTHDPTGGLAARKLAEALVASRDGRIKYIISNRQICSGSDGPQPWVWRPYHGKNPHTQHMHLSVKSDKLHYDSTKLWVADFPVAKPVPPPEDKPLHKSKTAAGAVVAGGVVAYQAWYASGWNLLFLLLAMAAIGGVIYWRWRDHGRGRD